MLPARAMQPTDKAACERAFAPIQSLLLELVPGWRGIDVADRGADTEADAAWTVAEMEHLLASRIVAVWQNRRLDQHAPAWDPSGRHSPNTLFAAAARDGIALLRSWLKEPGRAAAYQHALQEVAENAFGNAQQHAGDRVDAGTMAGHVYSNSGSSNP